MAATVSGAHLMAVSTDAEATRAFVRDALGLYQPSHPTAI